MMDEQKKTPQESEYEILKEYNAFRIQIYKTAVAISAMVVFLYGPVWILFFSFNWAFPIGIAAGTVAGILAFELNAWSCRKIIFSGSGAKSTSILSYAGRLLIYGASFYVCALYNMFYCGFGCVFGIMTIKIAIYYLHALKPWLTEKYRAPEKIKEKEEE